MNHLDDLDRRILQQLQQDADLSNQQLAQLVHASPPTCLRRVRRLKKAGVILRTVSLAAPVAQDIGLTAIVEITLERQSADALAAFEVWVAPEPAVVQCYRVSPGPDLVLMLALTDMAAYHQLAHRLLTAQANVRNVRAFFVTHCAKFEPRQPAP
ncbi:MAG: Lrp/AsnC family transcriptional regulator [Paludibacterium sp.]|uniref:Lrp/AsnC family transcriptional regulator n=1 Tax=Paludibacterium sp. TaxID=1917523 RepID=UPI0025CE0E6C|nr:Lrp/AsnC family transcriptional regulator [Paludibacterium sp.]MBV8046185.1 Lrp/AsnC family transcriptional regulator [Paludibacterium sp.]MBV8649320.1 Lrp/AsnC family transcriptional regulator [Paludibacterium sp.]